MSSLFCQLKDPIVNHLWHTEYACAWYFMSTYVPVQDNLLVYVGMQIVWCVWEFECDFWALLPAFLCTFRTFLQALSHTNACLKSSVVWPVCSERERDCFPLLCVCRWDTSRLRFQAPWTNRSSEGVCAGSAAPKIHLQGFSFTIHIHYASTFAQLEWKMCFTVVAINEGSKQLKNNKKSL